MTPPDQLPPRTTRLFRHALGGRPPADGEPDLPAVAAAETETLSMKTVDVDRLAPPPAASAAAIQSRRFPVTWGGYEVLRPLGSGGMAEVYVATHLRLKRQVALKVLKPVVAADPDFAARFLREARVMAQMTHGNVVRIYEAGTCEGRLYMAQELLTGGDLARRLGQRGALGLEEALGVVSDCAAGLEALHLAGLVHRDIKPANIFLDQQGRPKLGDLGLARGVSGEDRLTVSGTSWGTPSYMSPEQIVGSGDLDIRSDIYALGATLYTLLVGSEPFAGGSPYVITLKAMTEPVPDPRLIDRTIPADVVALIHRAMAKDRTQRPATPKALREAIDAVRLRLRQGVAEAVVSPLAAVRPAVPPALRRERRGRGASRRLILGGVFAGLALTVALAMRSLADQQGAILPAGAAPAWAAASGSDALGSWADLAIAGLTRRLRYCPPARFAMGSAPAEPGHQPWENRHEVVVATGFWMLAGECDQSLYRAVMNAEPSRLRGEDLPVDSLTQGEAQAFCAALAARGVPARLPSEAEWEYACRAGEPEPVPSSASAARPSAWVATGALLEAWRTGGDGPGGAQSAQRHLDEQLDGTALGSRPGARLQANRFGLFDLRGNVAEWCADTWDGYSPYSGHSAAPATSGPLAIARGGSWFTPPAHARAAARAGYDPGARQPYLGFRFIVPQP